MIVDFLSNAFEKNKHRDAIIWKEQAYTYGWLLERMAFWEHSIQKKAIKPGAVTILEGDFSPNSIALFLALMKHRCIIVPLTQSVTAKKSEFIRIAEGEIHYTIVQSDTVEINVCLHSADHPIYNDLRSKQHPGLVLFSSGSTGTSKAAVHDLFTLLEKFTVPRHSLRSITFLLYDHIGGVNTLFYNLANGGCLITIADHKPDTVLSSIEKHGAELLPTSPTFLNLILISEAYKRYNLNTLKLLTYGTESMPEATLKRFHELYPHVRLLQTYGLSEVGILRSKSKSSDSLWMKIGGEGYETRVVDGVLHIKANSSMLGYLNAPSPFTSDGWFNTGDAVEVEGEYVKILGRRSEIINVGGEKVYPAEIENILLLMPNVRDVTVRGEPNPITGQVVMARFNLVEEENQASFRKRMRLFCRDKLPTFAIPVRIEITTGEQFSQRFKKMRRDIQDL